MRLRCLSLAMLLLLLGSCRTATVPELQLTQPIAVESLRLNRCATGKARACRTDQDCGKAPCVSVLLSDSGAFGRDAGHTIAVGDRTLWLFGDSFTPSGIHSATAGWSDRTDPMTLRDVREPNGSVAQVLPFTGEEDGYNRGRGKPPACCRERNDCPKEKPYCRCEPAIDCSTRVALWPGDGFAVDGQQAIFFYEKHRIGVAPYDFRPLGTGIARLTYGDPQAQRVESAPGQPLYLFDASEPQFSRGVRVEEGGGYFYLYAPTNRVACAVDVLSARVPLTSVTDRAKYEFWNGRGWSGDLEAAAPILTQIPGGLGAVGWNDHLERYLSVWSDVCTGGNKLLLRTAPAPQGPWSSPAEIDLTRFGADQEAYYGLWHPAFGRGRELVISFYQPEAMLHGQIRLLRVQLP